MSPVSYDESAVVGQKKPLSRLQKSGKGQAGFSLMELLAVTAVMALVSGVILTSNTKFGGQVLLQNLAYDMALSMRQAQVYGIAVQRYDVNNFSVGYGIHLDKSTSAQYILFGDGASPSNGLYDSGENIVQSTSISNGFKINNLCAVAQGATTETCGFDAMDILFRRPEPDALISMKPAGGIFTSCLQNPSTACFVKARIEVKAPRGNVSSVVIDQNGQITVQ